MSHWGASSGGMHARRATRYNRGRWELERERCRIDDPRPPAPDAEAMPIQRAIKAVLRRLRARAGDQSRQADRLTPAWASAAGAEIRAHCRPGPLEHGCLVVYVDNNLWLHQIRRFHARRMETVLREHLGPTFKRLILRLDPG